MTNFFQDQAHYTEIFLEHNGNGPWVCFFCNEEILPDEKPRSRCSLAVHHKNHNHDDNRKSNLKPAHWGCHISHHRTGSVSTTEQRMKISASIKKHWETRDRTFTLEHRANLSEAHKGKVTSPEVRAKMSAAAVGIPKSPETRANMSAAQRKRRRVSL